MPGKLNGTRPDRAVAKLLVGDLPSNSPLVDLLEELGISFRATIVTNLPDPELYVAGIRYRGIDQIRSFVESRKTA